MSNSPNILVVAHEPSVAHALSDTLARLGFPATTAGSSQEALAFVDHHHRPAIALIDSDLPGEIDGVELTERFTSLFKIPVFYLADSIDALRNERVTKSAPHGYLIKPVEEQELKSTLMLAFESIREAAESRIQEPHLMAPLKESEALLVTDLTGRISYLNPLAEDLTGWSLRDALHRSYQEVFQLVDEEGRTFGHLPFEKDGSAAAGRPVNCLLVTRAGERCQISEQTTNLTDQEGRLTGLAVVFRRASAPVALETQSSNGVSSNLSSNGNAPAPFAVNEPSLGRLTAIVEGIADPLIALDENWRVTFVNKPAEEHLGRPHEQLMGRVFWDEFPETVDSKIYYEYYQSATLQQPRDFEFHDDAKDRWMEVHAYPFSEGLLVFLRDITERKKADEQSSKLEKLESLGLLARGFAHDFNNLLTVLLGNVSLAAVQSPGEEDYAEALDAAKQATIQAQNLVQQLLTFAKGGVPIKESMDLNVIVRELMEKRQRLHHVDYHCKLPQDPVRTEIDKGQFRRLLENLIQNAEESMPAGGSISVSASAFDRTAANGMHLPNLDPNTQYVVVEVVDNGEGIPGVNLDKIFEPYFSTRSDANATGLGLTVCDSIARAHKGFLSMESRYGEFTRASLFLPALHQSWQPVEQPQATPNRVANNPARVLVLEDEKSIRTLISMALKRSGYDVVETEEGSQTVEVYGKALEANERFDLVIMDLSIPNGMGGAEAIQQIRYVDPDVAAVVSSGYSDDPVMANYEQYGFVAVLPKPYEPSALRDLVNEILRAEALPS